MAIVFVCLHFLLYPATNGFNSYYDRDEESIGGLKHPPKITNELIYLSLLLDLIAIILALKISFLFALCILLYGLVSKAYSHPAVRLKKYPWISWVVAGVFQGAFTLLMCYIGLNNFSIVQVSNPQVLLAAGLTTILLWANYPLTQIYQHNEDARRGDRTLSRKLGIKGTFIFAGIFFIISMASFILYFTSFFNESFAIVFMVSMVFPSAFFCLWFYKYKLRKDVIDYTHAMRLNWISAIVMNIFFLYLFLESTQVMQAINGGY